MKLPPLEPCEAPWWAATGHAQTVIGHLLPSEMLRSLGERCEVPLADGEKLVAWFTPGTSNVVVYVFHGLAGDTDSGYMHRTARVALAQGHSVYLVNHRGCGEGFPLAARPYHSGRGEDVSSVIEFGRKRHPNKRHVAVGFSLGGNALLCLLTGLRGETLPDAAIAVNSPIDLKAVATKIGQGFNRVYDQRFVGLLKKDLRRKKREGILDQIPELPRKLSLMEFDTLYTGPVGGFGTGDGYYAACSTAGHLQKISVPTVILTAQDDPFVPYAVYREAKLSPTTHLHAEPFGGHMGYLSRRNTPLGTKRWQDYALDFYLRALTA